MLDVAQFVFQLRFARPNDRRQDEAAALLMRANPQLMRAVDARDAPMRLGAWMAIHSGVMTAQTYLELGGDPNAAHEHYWSLLHHLCQLPTPATHEVIRLALEKGADVNRRDTCDLTPLMHALHHDAPDHTLDLLVAHGARIGDVATVGDNSISTLAYATRTVESFRSEYRRHTTLKWMLRVGADPFADIDDPFTDADHKPPATARIIEPYRQQWRVLALLGALLPSLGAPGALRAMAVQQTGVPARVLYFLN